MIYSRDDKKQAAFVRAFVDHFIDRRHLSVEEHANLGNYGNGAAFVRVAAGRQTGGLAYLVPKQNTPAAASRLLAKIRASFNKWWPRQGGQR